MARYKLWIPEQGTDLTDDCGDVSIVADTIDQARAYFAHWCEENDDDRSPIFVHSMKGRCRVLYARDIENGDGHEGAEPGDTTINWYGDDDGGDLLPGQIRAWELGAPRPHWLMEPMAPLAISAWDVQVGMGARHLVWGFGTVCLPPRKWRASGMPVFPILFDDGRRADLSLGQITLHYPCTWGSKVQAPPTRYRLTVAGEVVAEGVNEATAHELLDLRCLRLKAEWEAEMFTTYEADLAMAA